MLQTHTSAASLDTSVVPTATPSRSAARLRLAVGIATVGRPVILAQMLKRLSHQTRPADAVIVCAPAPADMEGAAEACPGITLLVGARGLPRQRNAILERLADYDAVVFFDDDFIPDERYLEVVERTLLANPDIVVTTGCVLKDGIGGAGLTFDAADAALAEATPSDGTAALDAVYNGYGCNMSLRLEPVRAHRLAFDVRLPLYGWLEDVDFSRQLARFGRIVRTDAAQGVHLGIKQGRQSGRKLGYSQIANPLYLMRKGTMRWDRALSQMARNIAMNTLRSLSPEPWIDRQGRLYGNTRALIDLVRARLDPTRVETM
jgi:GT2 family glycosyltransferase